VSDGLPLQELKRRVELPAAQPASAPGPHGDQSTLDVAGVTDTGGLDLELARPRAKWGCTRCERAGRRVPIGDPCGTCRFPDRA